MTTKLATRPTYVLKEAQINWSWEWHNSVPCPRCQGFGMVPAYGYEPVGNWTPEKPCPACGGQGRVRADGSPLPKRPPRVLQEIEIPF